MRVKIIASSPKGDQFGIDSIIGKTYEAVPREPDDDPGVVVNCAEFGGRIRINPEEYEIVEE